MLPLIFTLLSFFLMVGGTSLEAQGVKTVPPMLGAWVPFLVGEHMPHSQKLNKIGCHSWLGNTCHTVRN